MSLDYLANLHAKHEEWLRPVGGAAARMRPEELALLSDPARNLVRRAWPALDAHHVGCRCTLPMAMCAKTSAF